MSEPNICYEIGYYGYAKFRSKDILATDGNFQITHNDIFTSGVYGSGFLNASQHMAVAHDYPVITANIGFQLTDNGIYDQLGKSITTQRDKQHKVQIYPNGRSGYNSNAYVQSLQLNASQDSLVTGSISLKGSQVSSVFVDTTPGSVFHKKGEERIDQVTSNYLGLFAGYGSLWTFGNSNFSDQEVLSWGISVTQTVQLLKICNCSTDKLNQLIADYAVIGTVQVNGNGQILGVEKSFENESGFALSNKSTLKLKSNTNKTKTITFNNMQCTNISSSLKTGHDLVVTSFQFVTIGSSKLSDKIIDFGV